MRNTSFVLGAAAVAFLLLPGAAHALDRKAEAAAKAALKQAAAEFKQEKFDDAIQKLADALNTCGDNGCSNATKAALLRDLGALRLKQNGGRAMGEQALVAALQTDPRTAINPAYDSPELQEEFAAAKDEAKWSTAKQPEGDFKHTPPLEAAINTPLPIFVAYEGSEKVAKVIVHYLSPGADAPKTLTLKKRSGGWGALVPCAGVTRGVVRYWIEGQDGDGNVVASAGGANDPYYVPIHASVDGAGPSLPGSRPPKSCDDCPERTPACDGEGGSNEDSPFNSGTEEGEGEKKEEPTAHGSFSRFWLGIGGSIDILSMPAGNDACLLNSAAAPTSDYYCTNGDGTDFPSHASVTENDSLVKGRAGSLAGGLAAHDLRVYVSFDYAVTSAIMVGGRFGYVPSAYPGKAAVNDGHDFGSPLLLELRGTYLFGHEPLANTGLSPFAFVGGGATEFHGQNQVIVTQNLGTATSPNLVSTPKEAWFTGGPAFLELGGGARFALSKKWALSADVALRSAFGGLATYITATPEIFGQVGF